MGQTNLKLALERKFSLLAGELGSKQREVVEIETLFAKLPVLNERTARIEHLLNCAADLLIEIDPTWSRSKAKAVVPNVKKAPVEIGRITKFALDVLRDAVVPMTAREVAVRVMEMSNVKDYDKATLTRLTNSVLSTLKAKAGKVVENDGGWPQRWSVISLPQVRSAA